MNDLAERALQGAAAARRAAVAHPAVALGATGFVLAAFVVAAGGASADARPTRTLSRWFGVQSDHGWTPGAAGALLLGGLVALVLLWSVALRLVRRGRLGESRLWAVVAAWTAPFAIGPPLLDTTVYGYAAFGFVQRAGNAPSTHAPASLGDGAAVVEAVDATARGTVSAAGPLGSLLQHLAVPIGGSTALGAVLALRVVGVVAAVAIGRLAADVCADPADRPTAVVLTALSPLLLLYVVSSPRLEGPALAVALAALLAVKRRHWVRAIVLAVVAGEVLPQLLVLVPVVIAVHLSRSRASRWRVLVRDLGVAAALVAAAGVLLPDGWGWLRAIPAQLSEHTPYSIPYATGRVLAPIVTGASYDDLVIGGRLTSVIAAVCAVVYLLATARRRGAAATAGYALLVMALLAPNLYPWYLLWGLLCLAPAAAPAAAADRRLVVVGLTAAGCVLVTPGFGALASLLVTAGGLVLVLVAVLCTVRRRRTGGGQRPPETSRTAGRTSAR